MPTWLLYASLSAACAALIPIFGKLGMSEVNSTLATGIRSVFMTAALAAVVLFTKTYAKTEGLSAKSLSMICLAGLAGAASWLFYFRAIQIADVSKVAPIDKLSMPLGILLAVLLLGERPTWINWVGILLIAAGAYLAAWTTKAA
jgi:transporter family protein